MATVNIRAIRRLRLTAAAGIAAVLCVSAAACSSSSNSGSAGSASVSASTAAKLSPYELETVQDQAGSNPQYVAAGTQAAISAINASGGVNGHPIVLTTCSTNNDPNVAAQCARSAVANPKVVAFTDDSTSFSAQIDAVLATAGVPLIGGIPFSAGDFTSKIAFNSNPGALGTPAEAIMVIKQLGGKKIGAPYVDVPAGAGIKPLLEAIAGPLGGTVVGSVPIAINAGDVTPEAASVASAHPDGIIDALLTPQMVQFIKAYRQQGGSTPFVVGTNEISATTAQSQLSGVNSKLYAAGWFDLNSAGYKQYLSEMQKYQPKGLADNTDLTAAAWLGIHMFAMAAEKANAASKGAALTRSELLSTMNSWSDFSLGGMTPPIDFTTPQAALGGNFIRIQDPFYYPVQYKNGSWATMNNWSPVNLFTGAS